MNKKKKNQTGSFSFPCENSGFGHKDSVYEFLIPMIFVMYVLMLNSICLRFLYIDLRLEKKL